MIAKKASHPPAKATDQPLALGQRGARVRQLVAVKLSRVEWQLLLATTEVALKSEGSDDKSWLWVLQAQITEIADEVAEQVGLEFDGRTGGMGILRPIGEIDAETVEVNREIRDMAEVQS